VTRSLQDWFTVETVRTIYGNYFLKRLLQENDLTLPDLPEDDDIAKIPGVRVLKHFSPSSLNEEAK
jgi:hypothetical protein